MMFWYAHDIFLLALNEEVSGEYPHRDETHSANWNMKANRSLTKILYAGKTPTQKINIEFDDFLLLYWT